MTTGTGAAKGALTPVGDVPLRELLNGMAVPAYTTDAAGTLTWFNDAAASLAGRTPQIGFDRWCVTAKAFRPDGTLLPLDQLPMAAALRDEPFTTAAEVIGERPDGARFWFAAYPSVVRDQTGRIIAGMNVLIDITARKNAQAQSDELYRSMFVACPECVKIVDKSGRLLDMNAAGLRMIGAAARADAIGANVYDMIAPEHRDVFREFNEKVCGGERGTLEFEIVGLRGERRLMETHAVPLHDYNGETVHLAVARDITRQESTERAALRLSAIVDSSDDAIISKDLNGIITSWNRSAQRLFGYTAEEVIGKSVTILIPADRLDEEPMILGRLQRGDRVDHFETVRRRKDGTLVDISLTISPVRDRNGEIIGASKIARDVTESRRGERARTLLSAIVDSSDDAIISKDLNGIITTWNQSAQRLFGYTAEEAVGRPVTMLMPPERIDEEPGILARIRKGERVDHFETIRRRKDGTLLDISLTISPVKDAQGTIIGASKIARDITSQKRIQAALAESEARFRELANSMPQIVWTADKEGRLDYFNERWHQFTGMDADAPAAAAFDAFLHPEDREKWNTEWRRSLESGTPFAAECRFWDDRAHAWRWLMGRAVPARTEAGKLFKWFGSWTDIDDQKKSQEDLRRANQDLEQFAYSASHDLQEPVRTVQLYSEILSARHGKNFSPGALEYLGYVRQGAARMETLVNDLLSYTQLARIEIPEEPADANAAVSGAIDALRGVIDREHAEITAQSLPTLHVHSTHLQQLFQNLIGNAIKYRDPARTPEIHVSASRDQGEWMFSIRDNGIGIDPQYREKIFGLFKRLHTSDQYPGTGIGLAICQRIVERYNGRIWVDSEPGKGSVFRFALPE